MAEADQSHFAAGLLAAIPDPVIVIGPEAELHWANPAAERRFGWTLDALRGRSLDAFVHPDDHATALLSLVSVAGKEVGSLIELRLVDSTGRYSWFEVRGARFDQGPEGSVILDLRESTDRHRWEVGAGNTRMLGAVLDAQPTIVMVLEPDGAIRGANRAFTRSLGRALETSLGRSLYEVLVPADVGVARATLDGLLGSGGRAQIEARFLTAGGEEVPMSVTFVDLLVDDAVQGVVATASDISSLVEVRNELRYLVSHDDLTGLPNRAQLRHRLAEMLARQPPVQHSLVFGDVDSLKRINDEHGHGAGDAVLAEVAERLRRITRDGDFVARVSGDEFVMVLATTDERVVADVQRRIEAVLLAPVVLPDGTRVTVSMSTGVATTTPSMDVGELLAAADAAMYAAKRRRTTST
jgi:diguanylate cyclase (GGDEF)-like protein/PAS domain S-box-containing protein